MLQQSHEKYDMIILMIIESYSQSNTLYFLFVRENYFSAERMLFSLSKLITVRRAAESYLEIYMSEVYRGHRLLIYFNK